MLKSSSSVCIYLSQAPDKNFRPGSALPSGLLTLSPAIKGETILKDDHTVEFIPSEPFRNGTNYTANFHLGALCKVPEKFSHFRFQFDIVPLTVVFEPGELKAEPDDENALQYQGLLQSSDQIDASEIEKMVSASYLGQTLTQNGITTKTFTISTSVTWLKQSMNKT